MHQMWRLSEAVPQNLGLPVPTTVLLWLYVPDRTL